jgi:P4 family phage/plasmid primase-like protien
VKNEGNQGESKSKSKVKNGDGNSNNSSVGNDKRSDTSVQSSDEREQEKVKVPSVLNPYKDTYDAYLKAGFRGPLPIPYKDKHPPPVDFTGQRAPYPGLAEFEQWANDGKRHNICVRLAGVDEQYEIIGIDVDHYEKGGRDKKGFDQLKALEEKLGVLPETWISSARTDGKSGIRYFRVPRGLAFRGQAAKDIEIIRKGHRFAVVWPSIHPDKGTYWWFPTGVLPDKSGRAVWDGVLPDARLFPLLPEKWIDYLTNNRTIAVEDELIDVDSEVQEIYDWATDTFHKNECYHPAVGTAPEDDTQCTDCGDETPTCALMRQKLEKHKKLIEDEATSHDKLTNAHWNILHLAFEGHLGWNEAINELEEHFINITVGRGKRGLSEVEGEIFRSRIQALRQIKGKSDERLGKGMVAVDPLCVKMGGVCARELSRDKNNLRLVDGDDSNASNVTGSVNNDPPGELDDIPKGPTGPIEEYKTHDDDNARLFKAFYTDINTGFPSMHFAEGHGWIVWHSGKENIAQPHWENDRNGDQVMRRMWRVIRDIQYDHAEQLQSTFDIDLLAANAAGNVTASGNPVPGSALSAQKNELMKRKNWAERSGMKEPAEKAIETLKTLKEITIEAEALDGNDFLLGVANGVVQLDDQVDLRPARQSDLITLNTHVEWQEQPSNYARDKWQEYLDRFLPDSELQKAAQVAFGYCLIGGNREQKIFVLKGGTNTGKSTFIGALEACLGDYAQTVNQSIFQHHKLNPVLANALSKRLVFCSEFGTQNELSAAQIKQITGEDKVQAELKGKNELVESYAKFVPIIASNIVPKIIDADKAFENRLHVFPFDVTVNDKNLDSSKKRVLEESCQPAVLNWLIEGYKQYRNIGYLPVTAAMKQAKKTFVADLDEVSAFRNEYIYEHPQGYVSRKAMYEKFKMWWMEQNEQYNKIPSMNKFTRMMKAQGVETRDAKFRVNGELAYWWVGVRLSKSDSKVVKLPVPEKVGQTDESGTPKGGA